MKYRVECGQFSYIYNEIEYNINSSYTIFDLYFYTLKEFNVI
jgi:hypothetical protein